MLWRSKKSKRRDTAEEPAPYKGPIDLPSKLLEKGWKPFTN